MKIIIILKDGTKVTIPISHLMECEFKYVSGEYLWLDFKEHKYIPGELFNHPNIISTIADTYVNISAHVIKRVRIVPLSY